MPSTVVVALFAETGSNVWVSLQRYPIARFSNIAIEWITTYVNAHVNNAVVFDGIYFVTVHSNPA